MGRPSRGVKPVNYAQYSHGTFFDSNEYSDQERDASALDLNSEDEDSEGSNYDAKEDQDVMMDDDIFTDSGLDADQQGLKDTAFGSDEDDLMDTSASKSRRRNGNGIPIKRKNEAPKEPEELIKRGAAFAAKAEVLLKELRADDAGRLVNKADYVTLPDLKTPEQFNAFGDQTMAQVNALGAQTGDFNLHPFLSFISSPWDKRPEFHEQRNRANDPTRSPWRKAPPTEKEKQTAKTANGGVDRTLREIRDEILDASQYPVLRNVTFLPNPVPLGTPSWKLALYTTLGATPDDVAHRISKTDTLLDDRVVSHRQLRNRIRKKIDDWSRHHYGGFQWLGDRQKFRARKDFSEESEHKSRARKNESKAPKQKSSASKGKKEAKEGNSGPSKDSSGSKEKEQKHEFATAILGGWGERKGVSDLGYYFNTTWEVDIKLGVMRQPESTGGAKFRTTHPLWAPRKRDKIPQLLLDWRKEVVKLPDLPDLQDLIEDYKGEILLEDEDIEDDQIMSGVETGRKDGHSMRGDETGLEEGTLPEDDGQGGDLADHPPPPTTGKHTLSSSPAMKPPEKKGRKV